MTFIPHNHLPGRHLFLLGVITAFNLLILFIRNKAEENAEYNVQARGAQKKAAEKRGDELQVRFDDCVRRAPQRYRRRQTLYVKHEDVERKDH